MNGGPNGPTAADYARAAAYDAQDTARALVQRVEKLERDVFELREVVLWLKRQQLGGSQ